MTAEQTDEYEFSERAAIREYDGDQPRGTAKFFAEREIEIRKAQASIRKRKRDTRPKENKTAETTDGRPAKTINGQIESLREEWYRIGKKMRAEKDPARKDELFGKWMDLCQQIIELRKESKK
jgi:hypothetical protein